MATATEVTQATSNAAIADVMTRHPSQVKMIDDLDKLAEAIDLLPLDARLWWHGRETCAIFLERDTFRELFRGQKVRVDDKDNWTITVGDVMFTSMGLLSQSPTREVTL